VHLKVRAEQHLKQGGGLGGGGNLAIARERAR
jgi:hypothetical protein